jgi:hypothetical protein
LLDALGQISVLNVRYQQKKFSTPIAATKLTDLDYDLRVGKIKQREYAQLVSARMMPQTHDVALLRKASGRQ